MRPIIASAAAGFLATVVNAAHHDVNVGKGGELKFFPEDLSGVRVGDTVTYHFFAKVCVLKERNCKALITVPNFFFFFLTLANVNNRITLSLNPLLTSRASLSKTGFSRGLLQ